MRHQIMRQRSLFRHLAHEHCDRAPDRLIDVNDENFVAIPDENCATATGWEYGANMYFNDRFVHCVTVPMEGRKTSCSQPHRRARPTFRTYAFSAKSGNDCFWRAQERRPARTLPAVFGSLAKHNIVGKLPTIAGWQPALPGSPRHTETARDLLLVFFESTLHVPPDQQLSALQPLTK